MKKMLTVLLVIAAVMVAACGSQAATQQTATPTPRPTPKPAVIITEFALPTAGSLPGDITLGPDGNLWFTEFNGNKIGRITPRGQITEFPIPTANNTPFAITTGHDGNLWFTECAGESGGICTDGGQIGRITPSGSFTEFDTLTSRGIGAGLPASSGIAAGPDGNLWFIEDKGNKIGRIPSGK